MNFAILIGRNAMHTNSELRSLSVEMAVNVVSCCHWLTQERKEFVMSKQLLRSGTGIGANIHEVHYGSSKADFINKLQVALKEAAETEYWLVVLQRTGCFDDSFAVLKRQCTALMRLLTTSTNTAKANVG